jgi:hypothetical protein
VLRVNLNKPHEKLGELLCIIIYNICPQIWRCYCHWLVPYSCEWPYGLAYVQHFTYDSVWAIQFILHVVYICSRSQFCVLCTVHIKIECVSSDLQHLGWHWPTLNVTESEIYKLLDVHFLRSMLNGTHTCGNHGPCTLPVKRHTFFTHFLQYICIIGKQVLGNMNMNFQNLPSEVLFLNFLFLTEQWNSSHISEYTVLLTQNV